MASRGDQADFFDGTLCHQQLNAHVILLACAAELGYTFAPIEERAGTHWSQPYWSDVRQVHIDPASGGTIRISLTRTIPPIDPPADTKYVKHVKFRSEILSKWWGTDIELGAVVVLPEGFDEHPTERYPIAYDQGHVPRTFSGFRETPPGPDVTSAPGKADVTRPIRR